MCLNGGECKVKWSKPKCRCPPGYFGKYCQKHVENCDTIICHNGGECELKGSRAKCRCPPGFFGKYCQSKPSLAKSSATQHKV
ncbi:delta-like protein [Plakobranchus ocellatus]|uniref:Delta-like protein n=1 Tax=Plakobranchus ocellatus TaxID=259542 RepID=A0AAV4C4N8_9GAST|nr:delta-like protein [Plakobranchus ocellatus]